MIEPLITVGVAFLMITFGIDQLIRPKEWAGYLPKSIVFLSPFDGETLMRAHATGNVLIGSLLLIPTFPDLSAAIAFIWFLTILPFAYRENWRIGARDTVITLAVLSLLI